LHLLRKFTHLIQTATMLLVCAFGPGVDEVDLDKADQRFDAATPLLAHLFADAAYPKAAAMRELHRDFGVQAALFAALCLWRCRCEMRTCSDQVRCRRGNRCMPVVQCSLSFAFASP
jgi:hypothetical protein